MALRLRSASVFYQAFSPYNSFFLLSFQYKMRFLITDLEAGMTPFAKAAATLAACIGAFTVIVCIVEGLAG
jgi:hypothetical protein